MTVEDNTPAPYRAEAYDKDWTPEQLATIYTRLHDEYTRLQELTNRARNRYPFEVERALYNQHNRRQRLENELKLLRRINKITYSISEPATSVSRPLFRGTTNTCYESLISSLLNKEPAYVVLGSNLEDTSVSFLHVCALCLVLPQFPQRCTAG
jgi:hypothetical protein